MARLGAPRDGDVAAAGPLEGDGALDGVLVDLLVGRAGRDVAVRAAARGGGGDARGLEAGLGLALGELCGGGDGGEERDEDDGELRWLLDFKYFLTCELSLC